MRMTPRLVAALAIGLLPAAHAAPTAVVFSAMGCGPYTPEDAAALARYVRLENEAEPRSAFLVHLGDINSGTAAKDGLLDDAHYARIRGLLLDGNRIPTFIVPGDNEWNDRPDPDAGWESWARHLMRIDETTAKPWLVERQETRPENFAFTIDGVVFVGINLVGGRVHDKAEWKARFADDARWIDARLATEGARGAVVFCQANPVGSGDGAGAVKARFRPFVEPFVRSAARFGRPVLLLHADGHQWIVDRPWPEAPNLTRVQVDRVEPRFPPVQVTVDPEAAERADVFRFDRRLEEWPAAAAATSPPK